MSDHIVDSCDFLLLDNGNVRVRLTAWPDDPETEEVVNTICEVPFGMLEAIVNVKERPTLVKE